MNRHGIGYSLRMWTRLLMALLVGAGALASAERMAGPEFTQDNQLLRPANYHEWTFVGSSLGMSYDKGQADYAPEFHNIYIQPEAYRQFARTGKFPDKTMLVMEIRSAGSNVSINKQGHFEDRLRGIDAAVKDEARFPEKWAYFSFMEDGGQTPDQAKPFAKEACWKCHHQHGAVDNVFVQFYPVLREAARQSGEPESHDRR
jgi:cytochrome P460